MKTLLLAAVALTLSACATLSADKVVLTAERGAMLARASHSVLCGGVESAHASGALTGAKFNQAKALCIKADDGLDVADLAISEGRPAAAVAQINQAIGFLESLKVITGKAL